MGLIAGTDVPPNGIENQPPIWFRVPTPTYSDSTASDYDLDQDTIDEDDDPLTYTHDATSTALPTGVSIVGNLLRASASVSTGTTVGVRIICDDGFNTGVPSPNFSIVVQGNSPPTWTSIPNPVFSDSTAGSYNLDNDTNDVDGDPLTYTHDATSTALPTGVSISGNSLVATTSVSTGTTNNVRLKVDDGVNTPVTSANFTIEVDPAFVVSDQELSDAGYLLVDDFGADPTGTFDSIVAINNCITQARTDQKPVWFSKGATYLVSDSVRCFTWDKDTGDPFAPTHPPELYGGGEDGTRPLIKLINGSAGFSNATDAHPVVVYRFFPFAGEGVEPTDVLEDTGIFESLSANHFFATFQNIDIDCGNNTGAFGMYFASAQRCFASDVNIDCSQAQGGWWGLLGRNSTITNLKITGGVWPLRDDIGLQRDGNAGIVLTGITLHCDSRTEIPIETSDLVPLVIVGFTFVAGGFLGDWFQIVGGGITANGMICIIDGTITGGNRVIANSAGKNLYVRNVYASGINSLIQSGNNSVISETGTWQRIAEYAYTDQTSETASSGNYISQSIVNGVKSTTTTQPINSTQSSVSVPTIDYVDYHTVSMPRITDGPYVNILDHNATSGPELFASGAYRDDFGYDISTADSLAAFNAAISAATAAGHNRVLVPRGFFYVSGVVDLDADTKMFGVSSTVSKIGVKSSWQPTSKVYVVRTANSATGTCQWNELSISVRTNDGISNDPLNVPPTYDWFSWIHWRTGKDSSSVQRVTEKEYPKNPALPQGVSGAAAATNPHDYYYFTNNGGGKHYGFTDCTGRGYNVPLSIGLRMETTSQPAFFYGYNPEMGKGGPSATTTVPYCSILTNVSNVRIYGTKREGSGSNWLCDGVNNFAHFGIGRTDAGAGTTDGINAGCHIKGTSDKFLIACLAHDEKDSTSSANKYHTYEDTTAESPVGISFPNLVSVHKRGELDDAAMGIAPTPTNMITGISFDFPSLLNDPPGQTGVRAEESDNWPITWAWDGHQYTSFGDGKGFHNHGSPYAETRASFGFSRIEGTKTGYSAYDVFKSGESMPSSEQGKCYGMLGANAKLYAAVDYFLVGGSGSGADRYEGVSVISSADAGVSWTEEIRWDFNDWGTGNADGFYSMSFVQFGQDHAKPGSSHPSLAAQDDGYVYAILSEHNNNVYDVQIPGGITMIRCLESNLESGVKSDWEYISEIDSGNVPTWSTTITDRIMVWQDATDGNDSASISYNEPLKRYILTTFHNQRLTGQTSSDAYIGIYDAPEPWGPWNTILKTNVEILGLSDGTAVIYWCFSNKWLSVDGLDFVMVGTLLGRDEWGTIEGTFVYDG